MYCVLCTVQCSVLVYCRIKCELRFTGSRDGVVLVGMSLSVTFSVQYRFVGVSIYSLGGNYPNSESEKQQKHQSPK